MASVPARIRLHRPAVRRLDCRSDLWILSSILQASAGATRLIFTTKDRIIEVSLIQPLPPLVGQTMLPPPARRGSIRDVVRQDACPCLRLGVDRLRLPVHEPGRRVRDLRARGGLVDGPLSPPPLRNRSAHDHQHHRSCGARRAYRQDCALQRNVRIRCGASLRGIGLPALRYDVDGLATTSQGTETATA